VLLTENIYGFSGASPRGGLG